MCFSSYANKNFECLIEIFLFVVDAARENALAASKLYRKRWSNRHMHMLREEGLGRHPNVEHAVIAILEENYTNRTRRQT